MRRRRRHSSSPRWLARQGSIAALPRHLRAQRRHISTARLACTRSHSARAAVSAQATASASPHSLSSSAAAGSIASASNVQGTSSHAPAPSAES
ncbi:hypothetical protein RI054_08g43890 [Pseudoscourfieldia marina]